MSLSIDNLADVLRKSISPEHAKEAERILKSYENEKGFSILLLQLVSGSQYDNNVRLAAALFFKNFIKRKWVNDDGVHRLPEDEVALVKHEIIPLMISLSQVLQIQIGEAISTIADADFPDRWPDLVPDLVARLGTDPKVNNGVLTVAHSIFNRWRPLFRSDALFLEIAMVLKQFTSPYLQQMEHTDSIITANSGNAQVLTEEFETMNLLVQIYFDLNCQDIPEFFEDNLEKFMEIFYRYLTYENNLLKSDDENEPEITLAVKTGICEVLELYTLRYEDVFGRLLPKFVEAVWNLLTSTGTEPKYDILVSKALAFLTAVVKIPSQVGIFASEEVLDQVLKSVIIPNMALRPSDEELFEDDPIEYTRRDLDGSDSDTRRRSATDFLRELTDKLDAQVTQVVMKYVEGYMGVYDQNRTENWRAKDTATYMFSSIAAKGNLTNAGVTATNLLTDVVGYFVQNIAPDLVETNISPILKVDAIKYINTFRNQLTKEQLASTFPLLSNHLLSNDFVVYTYAAVTIEKILTIRQGSTQMFHKDDISPVAQDLLTNLFRLIYEGKENSPEKLAENEFLMKCIMRILITCQELTAPYGEHLLKQLIGTIEIISKNPSNPKFTHYAFESVGSVLRFDATIIGLDKVESVVIPQFMTMLANDVSEFIPYIFQILAQLLYLGDDSAPLSDAYKALVRPILSPSLWESRGNVPGLVAFLRALLTRGHGVFLETNNLIPLLGVFQKLVSSKSLDSYGIDLLEEMFLYIPLDSLQNYIPQIASLLLQRLQSSRTDRFVIRFARLIFMLAAVESRPGLGPNFVIEMFDHVQDGIFGQIFTQFVLPVTARIKGNKDRKVALVGLVKLVLSSNKFMTGNYTSLWPESLAVLLKLLQSGIAEEETVYGIAEVDPEDLAFGSTFSRLGTATVKAPDLLPPTFNDPKEYFVDAFKTADKATSGSLSQRCLQLPDDVKQGLSSIGL